MYSIVGRSTLTDAPVSRIGYTGDTMTSGLDYALTQLIDETESTLTYRGYRCSDRFPVTIRLLRHPSSSEMAKFRHELSLVKNLQLPGIVQVLDLEKINNQPALVMEDIGGMSLHQFGSKQRLDVKQVLHVAIALADTLEAIHRAGIIHMNVMPHSVIIDPVGLTVKMTGFGSATHLSQDMQPAGNVGAFRGMLAYMSPEQTGRMNRAVDFRTDLYSFGVTVYELLTGELPFRSSDPLEIIHSHIARTPLAPKEVAPGVPDVLSDIVRMLLAKSPEERYQSAYGLKLDLLECQRQFAENGTIAPFPLGKHDRPSDLRVPQKLYGRDVERSILLEAWDRASHGRTELVLVAGYAGIGKSALVYELYNAVLRSTGYFVAGKFDQLNRTIPYAAVANAFRELIRMLLAESDQALAAWRTKLQRALGVNGKPLVELIPELELILGPQPNVPPLPPTESQNRFNLTFLRFCRAFADEQQPLAIFLDDLQWADPATLNFLQLLLMEPDLKHVLIIGAYRDNEVDVNHIFSIIVSELEKTDCSVRKVVLEPLDAEVVRQIVADTLSVDASEVQPLAELIYAKTRGNPFFMSQFMKTLYAEKYVSFDYHAHAWTWDLRRIQEMRSTDNVVDFMTNKLRSLPQPTQHVLDLASCIGYQFDLKTLAIIRETSPREVVRELWEALRQGFVLPLDAESQFLYASRDDADLESDTATNATFRFLHDRVQQAAYSLIQDGQRQAVHLRIGRLRLARIEQGELENELFNILGHLNMSAALITDPEERVEIARLNLSAGRKAKAGLAYQAAAGYLRTGTLLLPAPWQEEYTLTFALHAELAECEILAGHTDVAESLLDLLSKRAKTTMDRVDIHCTRIPFYSMLGRFTDAIATAVAALALLGIVIPEGAEERSAMLKAELSELDANAVGRDVATIFDLPVSSIPEISAAQRILSDLIFPAYGADAVVGTLAFVKLCNLSLRYGNSCNSARGYMMHAFQLVTGGERYAEGYALAKLAIALNEKFNNLRIAGTLLFLFSNFLHFFEPLQAELKSFARTRQVALESGDFTSASYSCLHTISIRLLRGDPLDSVRDENEQFLELMKRTKDLLATVVLMGARQVMANLMGLTSSRDSLSDTTFDEHTYAADMSKVEFTYMASWYYIFKLQLAYIYGDYEAARSYLAYAMEKTNSGWSSAYFATELPFMACLLYAALCDQSSDAERERHLAPMSPHRSKLAAWAELYPASYRHKYVLVQAELARLAGRDIEAMSLYDEAIELAAHNDFPRDAAIANELCGKFYLAKGRTKSARVYFTDAYYGYLNWGAIAKTDDMTAKFPQIIASSTLSSESREQRKDAAVVDASVASASKLNRNLVDVETLIRAAQAMAGEVVLEDLLKRLMDIVLKNAGAQKAVLILDREGSLVVEAAMAVDPKVIRIGQRTPIENSDELPLSVVQYVVRTREPVMLGDAFRDPRFAADPYVSARNLRSVLCLAIVHKNRAMGILYLENNATNQAFTPARFELLTLILAQAATSVENALLYEHIQRRTEELRITEERLQVEFAERARSEEARIALQDEIIRAQNDRLAEMSTPLIPITDRIMVMPLIGVMDSARAQQALSTALQGVQTSRAGVVILDVTGVKFVDTNVANTLIGTATALRLLGTKTVITGLRPDMAQMLVSLQVSFGSIVTKGTLQSGIAYALQQTGSRERS